MKRIAWSTTLSFKIQKFRFKLSCNNRCMQINGELIKVGEKTLLLDCLFIEALQKRSLKDQKEKLYFES